MTIKSIRIPGSTRTVKLGRTRPKNRWPRLRLSRYLRRGLPQPPATIDWTALCQKSLQSVFMNDQLGCCVISGGYHLVGAFTGNAGNEFVASDQQIISDYSAIGGYVPGRPDTDNGCDEETALNYWMKQGFQNGTKLAGWLSVDPSNQTELQQAVAIFEHVYWGMEMPDQWINQAMPQFPGGSLASPAAVWDMAGDPNPDNGHCITSFAFNASGLLTDTWGSLVSLTWEAAAYYGGSNQDGEAYVVLSPDLLNAASQKAPNALDWASLVADFNSMGGNVTPPPAPPAPPPTPPPTDPDPGREPGLVGTACGRGLRRIALQ